MHEIFTLHILAIPHITYITVYPSPQGSMRVARLGQVVELSNTPSMLLPDNYR